MKRAIALIFVSAFCLTAQTPEAAKPQNFSVSGYVREKATGRPLPNYSVSTSVDATWVDNTIKTSAATKDVQTQTDEGGHYRLSDLPAGQYRIRSRGQAFVGGQSKNIQLTGDLETLDFEIVVPGTISGKVLDENGEPIPGMTILAVSREYFLGNIGYFLKSSGRTNDRGEYKVESLEAARPYLLVAEKREQKLPARSETPLNPALRRKIPMRTWYPNSIDREAAAPVVLRPGEDRTGVNISIKRSASFCAEGVISTPNGTEPLNFSVEALRPSNGPSAGSGMFMLTPGGLTGADGKFRICDLYPGSYRLMAMPRPVSFNQPISTYAVRTFDIGDRDLSGMQIATVPGVDLQGEIVLDGPPPPQPLTVKTTFSLIPLLRTPMGGEQLGGRYDIPGTFAIKGILSDDFYVRTFLISPGLYVRDVTFEGRSILYDRLRIGSTLGEAGVKVVVGQDGGTISLQITEKDGKPVPDMQVVLIPADVISEGELAARFVSTLAGQDGTYTSTTLRPGKYFVAATAKPFDATVESIVNLWQSRVRFTEVVVPPNGKVKVNLEPLR